MELERGILVPMPVLYFVSRQKPGASLAVDLGSAQVETPMGSHLAVGDFQGTSTSGVFAAVDRQRRGGGLPSGPFGPVAGA